MASRARRIVFKTLRWTLRVVLALVFLVLVVLVLVLYSPGFLHMVINVGLGFYNDRIPGEIRIGRVEGRLADHLVLGDIYLEDHNGRVLVAGRQLTLDWHPWDLLSGGITVDRVALEDAQVHLVAGGGFGDLAMPGPEKPPRETVAPAMPLHLWVGEVAIDGVDLFKDTGETIAGGVRLAARDLDWSGLVAHLKIDDAAAALPGGVQLEALALTADYAEPRLQLTGLVTSDLAIAELVRVDFDASSLTGEVLVAVDGRRGALANKFTGALADKLRDAPGDPSIRISAKGEAGDLDVGLRAVVPGIGGLELAASGRPFGAPHLQLRGRADVDLTGLIPPPHGAQFGLVRPTFEADVRGPDWSRLTAELRLGCLECGAASGLDLHALARNDSVLSDASALVELEGAGVVLKAEVQAGPRGVEAGHWNLRVPQVAEPLGIARLFKDLPPISGALATHGSCTGAPLRCEGHIEVGDFIGYNARAGAVKVHLHAEPLAPVPIAHAEVSARDVHVPNYRFAGAEVTADVGPSKTHPPDTDHPLGVLEAAIKGEVWVRERDKGDRGTIAARVLPGPPLVIYLDHLDVRMRGLQALLPKPARIEIAGRRFDVKNFGLQAAGGHIGVDGRADLDGRSDIKATIDSVRLAPLAALVPKLRGKIKGTVSARASLQGPAQSPEISLELGGQKLSFGEGSLGDLDLTVGVGKGRARAALGLTSTMAERVALAAEMPLDLDLSRGKFGVRNGGIHLALDIKNFRLASLRPWIKGMPPHGVVTVQATVDGSAAKPAVKLMARGRGIVVSAKEPPASFDLDLEQHADEDSKLRLDVERLGGRARINVTQLPARVNLVDGGIKWRPEDHHEATIVIRDVDLWRQLNPLLPGNDFAGRIEAEGSISGPMTAPVLALNFKGDGLRMRDAQIGKMRLGVGFKDQKATVDLSVRGQVAREISLHAEAPLAVALHRGKVAWLKDDPHVISARIRGFELAGLKQLGVTAAWAGTVDVDAQLRGSATVPEFKVHTDLKEIVWKSRRVGTVHGDIDYHGKRVKVGVQGQIGDKAKVNLKANAPLAVDLGRGSFKWDENGQHDIELRVDDLDRTTLAPLGRVPEEALLELSLVAQAKGNLASFHAGLEAHGQMGHKLIGGAPLHISAVVDPNSQGLKFSVGPHKWAGEIKVKVDSKADILGLVRGTAKAGDIPFTASLRAPKFDSRFAQAFVPRQLYDINGELSAAVDAKGTVGSPDVRGELKLRRGSITVLQLQQRIREIELDVSASGRTIVVKDLSASSGKGRMRATATIELPRGGGMKLVSAVRLVKFPLVRPGLPQMQISTSVNADMASTEEETKVDLKIRGTKVYVTGYTVDPPKRIPENPNITFKDNTTLVAVASTEGDEVSAENEERQPKKEEEPKPAKKFAMRINLVDPVDIRGPSTEMLWQGKVAATRDGDKREVTGKLTAKEGRLDLLGNRFKIQSGSVTLPKDEDTVDPFINVVATTSTTVAEVKATFRGRLTRPELIFSSEPAMSQSQILTLLLTGSPDATEADEDRVLAQAAALLATFQNPQLSAFLSSRLGIDHVGLSFGDDVNQPILSVGKRVTKNIYVETAYKHNAPRQKNKVEARVEYQFAPRWTIETFFGDAAVGGVDVFWRKVFGQPRRLDKSKPVPKGTGAGDSPRGGSTSEAPGGGGTGAGGGGGSR